MNDYVKSIVRKQMAKEILDELKEHLDFFSKDVPIETVKENLFETIFLKTDIENVIERFEDKKGE